MAFAAAELERLAAMIQAAAEPLCGAWFCALRLAPQPDRLCAPVTSRLPDCGTGRALDQMLDQVCAQPCDADSSGLVVREDLSGHPRVLVALPLCSARGRVLGAMALVFEAARWGGRGSVMCQEVARIAAALLDATAVRLRLERELRDMSLRVARLQRLSQIDPLTELENSASFERKVRDRLGETAQPAVLILLDIDHFKQINDLYGHQFGDRYLRMISGALAGCAPEGAVVGRIGGDEFGVFADLDPGALGWSEALMLRLRDAVQRAASLTGKPDLGRVSMGASLFPAQATDYVTLFKLADAALYAAKDAGRGTHAIFDALAPQPFVPRDLSRRFARAMAGDEVLPHFQPIVDLQTGRCTGYEVLARWKQPGRDPLAAGSFAAVFEDQDLAATLTRSMLLQSLEAVRGTPGFCAKDQRLSLGLNVTSFDLLNPGFLSDLDTALAAAAMGWEALTIEVTERIMLGEPEGQVFRALADLRRRGARIALDDFGMGYGGLRHLAGWPVDVLKIDRHFVRDLGRTPRDGAVIEAVLGLARRIGCRVVAEGIETPSQLACLRLMGCDAGQGHVFAAALDAAALATAPLSYDLDRLSDLMTAAQ
ncbi:putative bifunctional diguanylate cyclase/phosphodiesterase [Salipiger marinus]|uniref:Diguanylate cyclase/phosphodiesterase n=1 Tax=Salipiger marinus TaxID=555512 RepID=A0A1G8TRS6_9RHOB|nr:bifunctional diguanylate cyclase/phosphodiesterase [Salipiger marinus]SDJ43410.1 diguanylate cyclase/phosphodiesterase [Salipiger marinus]